MRDFAQQLSPRWTGFVSEKRFSEGIFRKSDFAIQRVTKPLLYQLSYVGAERQRLHPLASDSSGLNGKGMRAIEGNRPYLQKMNRLEEILQAKRQEIEHLRP